MYNLEINKAIDTIRKNNSKRVLLQLPDGLKPKASFIQQKISEKTDAQIFIWAGSCYGACDVPVDAAKRINADLIIQWGHSRWK